MDLTFLPPPTTTSRARFTVRSASSPSYRPAACRYGGGGAVRLGTLTATTRDDGKGRDVACRKTGARVNGVSQSETREEDGETARRGEDKGTLNGGMAAAVGASQRDAGDGENSDRAERTTRLYQRNNSDTKSNGVERREGPSSPERRSSGTGTLASSGDRDRVEVTTSPAGTGSVSGDGRPSPGASHAAAQQAPENRVSSSGVKTQAPDDRVSSSGVKTQAPDDRVFSSGVKTQAPDDRVSGVRTLPSRLKSRSMSGSTSGPRETTSVSLGPKGGQSIWERIEKLYRSTTTTADGPARAMKRFSAPLDDWRLPSRLDAAARRNSTATDFPLSAPVSPWGARQSLREARGSEDDYGGATEWGAAAAAAGITMSLDRSRGRQSVAAQIRRARAAGEEATTAAAPPPDNTAAAIAHRSTPQGAALLSDPSGGLREGCRASGNKDRATERGGEEEEEAADIVGAKETTTNDAERVGEPEKDRRTDAENVRDADALMRKGSGGLREEKETMKEADTLIRKGSGGLRDEHFKSVARNIHVKSTEAKKLVVPSAASVRNKISQYEALTQSALGSAGKHQKPRRAFSVPAELLCGLSAATARDGPKDSSEWDRGVGRLRGRRWDGGAGGSFSARERATSIETTETTGVRKSRSDRAIDEMKTPSRTIDDTVPSVGGKKKTPNRMGHDDSGGGSDRTTMVGIRGEPRDEEEERRRETRSTNAGAASTGDDVDPIPNVQELGDTGGGRTQTCVNLPVDRWCQRDAIGASALYLPLCDSNNNNDRGSRPRDQGTHNGDDDATPTNPDDKPCFSVIAVTARHSDDAAAPVRGDDAAGGVTVRGDDAAAVSSGPHGQKHSSGPSPCQHHHLLSSPPSCTTSTSAPGKLTHVVPSPLQVLSSGSVRNEGAAADDTLETCRAKSQGAAEDSLEAWVTSQGAAEDSVKTCRVKSQGADSLEAWVTSQGAAEDSMKTCRVKSQGVDSLEAWVKSQGKAEDSLKTCRVKSQGADSLEAWVTSQGAAEDSLEAWVTTWNQRIQGWNDRDDDDDDDGTEKDHDSNYDSDESSATITSSQSDRRSFCVSLADLCNLGGVEYESESDSSSSSEDWSNSLRSDMSALSYVSVMPAEELERLLQDVRGLGDSTLQSYEDVQVVVLHKDVGVGLGFSIAGGLDQNKPVTVHKVFPTGAAAQEGSVREGDHVLSINGTALCGSAHLEALRTLKRAKERSMGVVVLRRGAGRAATAATAPYKAGGGGVPASASQQTPPPTTTGQRVCVRLEKRSRDLGFSLEGGAGSSLGDKPLSIQKIFHGGPGEQVCPGDQLLQIQDISVVGMRRLEVWTLIKTLPPGPVDVVLHRPHKIPQT